MKSKIASFVKQITQPLIEPVVVCLDSGVELHMAGKVYFSPWDILLRRHIADGHLPIQYLYEAPHPHYCKYSITREGLSIEFTLTKHAIHIPP